MTARDSMIPGESLRRDTHVARPYSTASRASRPCFVWSGGIIPLSFREHIRCHSGR